MPKVKPNEDLSTLSKESRKFIVKEKGDVKAKDKFNQQTHRNYINKNSTVKGNSFDDRKERVEIKELSNERAEKKPIAINNEKNLSNDLKQSSKAPINKKPNIFNKNKTKEQEKILSSNQHVSTKSDITTVSTYNTSKSRKTKSLWRYILGTRFGKRDCQAQNTFTAKDVAALEVIVDLLKNPFFVDETNNPMCSRQKSTTSMKLQPNTNSIQVHIAIPYGDNDKKRSVDSLKVRRVFLAKMSTPVDLEYQVQSFVDVTETATAEKNLSPGMYLLVENGNLAKGSFALKPVQSNLYVREASTIAPINVKASTQKVETTSPKNLGRVTLSKDFVAAINEQQIDPNDPLCKMTLHNIKVRKTDYEARKISNKKVKRKVNWASIKKFFGHDKVCSCHCKPNTTLCRACAASDAVMRELLFEFDNLAQFMNDHCTEIQTYFWMNPTGGRKLRDAVHKIDKALYNYYKRVKGKCQGRPCETFSAYIDQRSFLVKRHNNYTKEELLNDIEALANDIEMATGFNFTSNQKFKDKSKDFVRAVRSCLATEALEKSKININPKNIYALDNINVNIICKPNSQSQFKEFRVPSTVLMTQPLMNYNANEYSSTTFETYDDDEVKKEKKMSRLRSLLSRIQNKKLETSPTYPPKEVINKILTSHHKRETKSSQIESPLIADTGGAFWQDYLSKGLIFNFNDTNPHIEAKVLPKPQVSSRRVTTAVKMFPLSSDTEQKSTKSNVYLTITLLPEKDIAQRTVETNTTKPELLSYNMDILYKLLESLPDVAEVRKLSTVTTFLKKGKSTKHKTKKTKTCTTKHAKTLKAKIKAPSSTKMLSNKSKHKPNQTTITSETQIKDINFPELPPDIEIVQEKVTESAKTIERNLLKRFKSVSDNIFNKIENIGFFKITTASDKFRRARTVMKLENFTANLFTTVKPKSTSTFPTIFILEEYETARSYDKDNFDINEANEQKKSNQNAKSILRSILKLETNNLNKEWKRFAVDEAKSEDDMDDLYFIGIHRVPR